MTDFDKEQPPIAVDEEDLEDGEIEDDEEEAQPLVPEVVSVSVHPAIEIDDSPDESRHSRKKSKKSSRKRGIDSDEEKKRILEAKLKKLERQMNNTAYSDEDDEEERVGSSSDSSRQPSEVVYSGEDEEMGVYVAGSSPKRHKPDYYDRYSSKETHRRPRRGRGAALKSAPPHRRRFKKVDELCKMFMAGKCPKTAESCLYSHDAIPPKINELCKFYLFERCAKREKCLYLHKGFPCKYYHTGQECMDADVSCKFSHEHLNDITRGILLKHLEAAPKEILGDFPRLPREAAAALVFAHEAKTKGWLEDPPRYDFEIESNKKKKSRWEAAEEQVAPDPAECKQDHFSAVKFSPNVHAGVFPPSYDLPNFSEIFFEDETQQFLKDHRDGYFKNGLPRSKASIPSSNNNNNNGQFAQPGPPSRNFQPEMDESSYQNDSYPKFDGYRGSRGNFRGRSGYRGRGRGGIRNQHYNGNDWQGASDENYSYSQYDQEESYSGPSSYDQFPVTKPMEDIQSQQYSDHIKINRDPRSRDPRNRSSPQPIDALDIDISGFDSLELPPMEEDVPSNSMGLPFKPHVPMGVATEIDASISSHSPLDYSLRPIYPRKPDYADVVSRQSITPSRISQDPRLHKYKKSEEYSLQHQQSSSVYNPKVDLYSSSNTLLKDTSTGAYSPSQDVQDIYNKNSGYFPQMDAPKAPRADPRVSRRDPRRRD